MLSVPGDKWYAYWPVLASPASRPKPFHFGGTRACDSPAGDCGFVCSKRTINGARTTAIKKLRVTRKASLSVPAMKQSRRESQRNQPFADRAWTDDSGICAWAALH